MYPSWSTGVHSPSKPNDFVISLTLFQVWHIRLTLHFLADAGNLLDCACLAGMVALKHFRRPDVEVIGDEITVVCVLFIHGNSMMNLNAEYHIISISLLNALQYP